MMIKYLKRLVYCLIILNLIPMNQMCYASADSFYVNESFNEYATNEMPNSLKINAKSYFVTEYQKHDKGLQINLNRVSSNISFNFDQTNIVCITFDIMCLKNAVTGNLCIKNNSGKEFAILKFNTDNELLTHNGQRFGGYNSFKMTRVSVVWNGKNKTYDLYLDGKRIFDKYRAAKAEVKDISSVDFMFSSEDIGEGIIFDNINIDNRTEPLKTYPVESFNDDVYDKVEAKTKAECGTSVMMNTDFEKNVPFTIINRNNTIAQNKEKNRNTVILFDRLNNSDFYMDGNGMTSDSDYVVYEFDINLIDIASCMSVKLRDSNACTSTIASLRNGVLSLGGMNITLSPNRWYHISSVYNYFDFTRDFYFNGNLVASGVGFEKGFMVGAIADTLRFFAPAESSPAKFMIDNCLVYDSMKPKENISDITTIKTIKLNNKTVFSSEVKQRKMVDGYIAIHTRSGVVVAGGKKELLKTTPYKENGITMVGVKNLCDILGVPIENSEGRILVNGKDLAGAEEINGELFAPLDMILGTCLGKKIYEDNTTINSGMVIAGDTMFSPPTDNEELQALNDYIFYLRPTAERVAADYEASGNKGQHPRIQATKADFDRIKEEVKTNLYKKAWAESIIQAADRLIGTETVRYELRDGLRLIYVSRDVLDHMYTLGMAYQLTGDSKYIEQAWVDLESVSNFPDWHPSHHLDLGEMCAAVAIGYDWMYAGFTEEQRRTIEMGIYKNGFYDACISYQTTNGRMADSATKDNNHNAVCQGGITMGALAFMDVYPEISTYLVSNAVRAVESMLCHFAPDGAWLEGPHYWEYTMQYTSKMLSSLIGVFENDYSLGTCEGLSTTADYMLYMQTNNGIYNYGDGVETKVYVPEMFWLSDKYENSGVTNILLKLTDGKMSNNEDLALALLWYDINVDAGSISFDLDKFYDGEGTIAMRDSWESKEPTFVGIHAGKTNVPHGHLDGGSFIFDSQGIRWAKDLGMGDYNSNDYFDSGENGKRWTWFRSRAESHNTIILNPSDKPDHAVNSYAKMTVLQSKPKGEIVSVDMSQLLKENANSARRGFAFTDNRKSLVIRDEINLCKESDAYWFMITASNVEISGNTAVLSQNGRKMKLEYITNGSAELTVGTAEKLPTSPVITGEKVESSKRIMLKVHGEGSLNITVKLSSFDTVGKNITDFDKSIDLWNIQDGELPELPTISNLMIGDKNIQVTKNSIDYIYAEDELSDVPDIIVPQSDFNIQVVKGSSLSEETKVYVTDKNDANNINAYHIYFKKLPKPVEFDGMESIGIANITASEEPQSECPAINVLDGDLSTRWSAEGTGQYLITDLNDIKRVDCAAIAFFQGSKRKTKIEISISKDDVDYETVFSGTSNGESDSYEFFDLGGKDARYVKIMCNGNTSQSSSGWNSISEVVVTRKK